jgi:thiamine-phosphate pyrophosphorylase
MPNVLRILDANANRAREALRVMEEAARFLLDDAELVEGLKSLRHDLAGALASVAGLEANRDTPGDVGTTIKTAREATRESAAEVAIAAGKRLSEALRALEEYGKTLGEPAGGLAARVEALRYRGYGLEQRLSLSMGSGARKQWRVCVLISESLCAGRDWLGVAKEAVEAGADCVQLREKALESSELLARTRRLVEACHPRGASVIVNDRADIALLGGADGVHVGQSDLPCAEVRRLVGRQLLVGVSTSKLAEAQQALRDGADYCGVGPMFHTTTKHKEHIVGPDYLRQFIAWGKLPHLAIGGVTAGNAGDLAAAGARGVAVSSAVCGSGDPAGTVRALLDALAVDHR